MSHLRDLVAASCVVVALPVDQKAVVVDDITEFEVTCAGVHCKRSGPTGLQPKEHILLQAAKVSEPNDTLRLIGSIHATELLTLIDSLCPKDRPDWTAVSTLKLARTTAATDGGDVLSVHGFDLYAEELGYIVLNQERCPVNAVAYKQLQAASLKGTMPAVPRVSTTGIRGDDIAELLHRNERTIFEQKLHQASGGKSTSKRYKLAITRSIQNSAAARSSFAALANVLSTGKGLYWWSPAGLVAPVKVTCASFSIETPSHTHTDRAQLKKVSPEEAKSRIVQSTLDLRIHGTTLSLYAKGLARGAMRTQDPTFLRLCQRVYLLSEAQARSGRWTTDSFQFACALELSIATDVKSPQYIVALPTTDLNEGCSDEYLAHFGKLTAPLLTRRANVCLRLRSLTELWGEGSSAPPSTVAQLLAAAPPLPPATPPARAPRVAPSPVATLPQPTPPVPATPHSPAAGPDPPAAPASAGQSASTPAPVTAMVDEEYDPEGPSAEAASKTDPIERPASLPDMAPEEYNPDQASQQSADRFLQQLSVFPSDCLSQVALPPAQLPLQSAAEVALPNELGLVAFLTGHCNTMTLGVFEAPHPPAALLHTKETLIHAKSQQEPRIHQNRRGWEDVTRDLELGRLLRTPVSRLNIHGLSNAGLKALELFTHFRIFDTPSPTLTYFDNAALPGSFILAAQYMVKTQHPSIHDFCWYASSLLDDSSRGRPFALKDTLDLWRNYPERWLMGRNDARHPSNHSAPTYYNNGDVTSTENQREWQQRLAGAVDVYTSDLGFEPRDFYSQEAEHFLPHLGQVLTAINVLKPGGKMVVKQFTFFESSTLALLAIISTLFEETWVVKPATSKPDNSECYIVGLGFIQPRPDVSLILYDILRGYETGQYHSHIKVTPAADLDWAFLNRLQFIADRLVRRQIDELNRVVMTYDLVHRRSLRIEQCEIVQRNHQLASWWLGYVPLRYFATRDHLRTRQSTAAARNDRDRSRGFGSGNGNDRRRSRERRDRPVPQLGPPSRKRQRSRGDGSHGPGKRERRRDSSPPYRSWGNPDNSRASSHHPMHDPSSHSRNSGSSSNDSNSSSNGRNPDVPPQGYSPHSPTQEPLTAAPSAGSFGTGPSALQQSFRFHNHIKEALIVKYVKRGASVLDIGIGRGGDLGKYQRREVGFVLGFDAHRGHIWDAQDRLTHPTPGYANNTSMASRVRLCHANWIDVIPPASPPMDVAIANLSFHYFFASTQMLRQLLGFISEALPQDGYFVGLTTDGDRMQALVGGADVASYVNGDFSLTVGCAGYPTQGLGVPVEMTIAGSIIEGGSAEYLVTRETLQTEAQAMGFAVREVRNAMEWQDVILPGISRLSELFMSFVLQKQVFV